jgi:hypothetical protein
MVETWTYATIELWDGITGEWYEYHTLPSYQEAYEFLDDPSASHPESVKYRIVTVTEFD